MGVNERPTTLGLAVLGLITALNIVIAVLLLPGTPSIALPGSGALQVLAVGEFALVLAVYRMARHRHAVAQA